MNRSRDAPAVLAGLAYVPHCKETHGLHRVCKSLLLCVRIALELAHLQCCKKEGRACISACLLLAARCLLLVVAAAAAAAAAALLLGTEFFPQVLERGVLVFTFGMHEVYCLFKYTFLPQQSLLTFGSYFTPVPLRFVPSVSSRVQACRVFNRGTCASARALGTFSPQFNGSAFSTLLIEYNVAAASVGPVALVADSRRAVQLRHAVSQG